MGQILAGSHEGVHVLRFEGDVRLTLCATADRYLTAMFADPEFKTVFVDLTGASGIDSTSLGLLAKLSLRAQDEYGFVPTMICDDPDLLRLLRSMGFEDVFAITDAMPEQPCDLGPLPELALPEAELRAQVLEAHRVLMGLNDENEATFRDLVAALEADADEGPDIAPPSPRQRASL